MWILQAPMLSANWVQMLPAISSSILDGIVARIQLHTPFWDHFESNFREIWEHCCWKFKKNATNANILFFHICFVWMYICINIYVACLHFHFLFQICSVPELRFIYPSPLHSYIWQFLLIRKFVWVLDLCLNVCICIWIVLSICFRFAQFLNCALSALPPLRLPGILIDSKLLRLQNSEVTLRDKKGETNVTLITTLVKCHIDYNSGKCQIDYLFNQVELLWQSGAGYMKELRRRWWITPQPKLIIFWTGNFFKHD